MKRMRLYLRRIVYLLLRKTVDNLYCYSYWNKMKIQQHLILASSKTTLPAFTSYSDKLQTSKLLHL